MIQFLNLNYFATQSNKESEALIEEPPQNLNSGKRSSRLVLKSDEIHLWVTQPQQLIVPQSDNINLVKTTPSVAKLLNAYRSLLTCSETQKQQRYLFEKDRHNALITRAFIRDLLSYYADVKPADWHFVYGKYDKPEIDNPPIPLKFNLSHSKDLIICAVTLTDDIGCDVENINRETDVLAIARDNFSTDEYKQLLGLSKGLQTGRFFDYWTLKESYIKACGLGLAMPLADFSFHIGHTKSAFFNNNIQLSFSKRKIDTPKVWSSWLFYPNKKHRIAISTRNLINQFPTNYKIRFFESTPLVKFKEFNIDLGN